jgi:tetratricopeptide (TPR) repeat protein
MASNVNIKFVAILSSSLLLLAVLVAGAAYVTLTKTGEDHIDAGDRFMAAGDYANASKSYSKGVHDNVTNVEWLKKWQEALLHTIPATDLEYSQNYSEHYLGILRRLASLQGTDPEAQRGVLDAMHNQLRLGGVGAENWTGFYELCNSSYANLDFTTPEAQRLLRYRGFARVALMPMVAMTPAEHDEAIEDLETAVAADPSDFEAIRHLSSIHRNDWIQALNASRPIAVKESAENLRKVIDRMRTAFADDPRMMAADLNYQIESRLRLDSSFQGQQQIRKNLRGIEEPLIEKFLACDPNLLSAELLVDTLSYGRAIWNMRPDDYNTIGLEITDRVIKARPDDFDLHFFRGAQLIIERRFDEAQESLQHAIDMPDLPISLDGLRLKSVRVNAVFQLANNALSKWESLPAGPDKDAALEQAHAFGDRLSEELGEHNPMALMINGQVAINEQRNQDAVTLLQRLNTQSNGENVSVIRLLASALKAQGTLGAAMDQYDKWIQLDPLDAIPLLESSQILIQLRDPEEAIRRLNIALTIFPDNEEIKQKINTLMISTGAGEGLEATDPVVAVMMRAEALSKSGGDEYAQSLELLAELIAEHPDDPRPLMMQADYMARTGNIEGALAASRRGQELSPGNESFNRMVAMLSSGDRGKITEDYIDNGNDPEAVKLVKKYSANIQLGDPERARMFLDQAEGLFPEHPAVLDALFVKAMQDDDMPKAREVAATAARTNADQCDGLLYEARLNLKQEAFTVAQNNLQIAVEKAPYSPQAWRLYGQVLLRIGRIEEAVNALARAHEYKPDDAEIAKTYASTLVQLQRFDTALTVVRAARRFTESDDQLNEIWLALEAEAGDPEIAIEHRTSLYNANPDDAQNMRILISLLTSRERFDESESLIQESLKSGKSDLGLAMIQAQWYARQDQVDEGERLIRAYIGSVDPGELNETPFLSLGNFLIANDRTEEGLEAFREGAKHQSPEMMTADRRIGDYFFSQGDYEQSLASYRKVTRAGADTSGLVAKRIIEALQRLKRWDEAESELNALATSGADDLQTTLLRADIAAGRGDLRTARELVNRAVEIAPNKPEPFIRRAQLDFDDAERLSFVLSDLDQAIRLIPTSMQPRRMRADALLRHNRSAEAIAELRRGIQAIPDNSELRRMLIQELWQSGRHDEAHAEARKAIEANPDNSIWLMVAGDIASRDDKLKNNWEVARDYYLRAYEHDKSLSLALRLANSCLYLPKPDPKAAIAALKEQGPEFETDSQILILRSRCAEVLGDHPGAIALAERSIAEAKNVGQLRHWFLHMEAIFEQQSEMIQFVDRMRSPEALMPAYAVHAAAFQAYDFSRHKQIILDLKNSEAAVIRFASEDLNNTTLVSLYRVLGQLAYGQGQFQDAADSFAKGVAQLPNDMEFNNNLAYTLAKYLGDLQGALAPAEKAVSLSPANSPALDTLGWIYYRLGRYGQAKLLITRAMANAERPIEKGGAYLHMAQILLAEGDRPEARKYAELAHDVIVHNPSIESEFKTDYDALMTELQEAENTR